MTIKPDLSFQTNRDKGWMNHANLAKLTLRFLFGYLAFVLAFSIAYEVLPWRRDDIPVSIMGFIYGGTALIYAAVLKTERSSWRFTSFEDLLRNVRASILIGITFLLIVFAVQRAILLPRSVLALTILIDFSLVAAARVSRRVLNERRGALSLLSGRRPADTNMQTLLLVGDLGKADAFLRELDREPDRAYRVTGIVGGEAGDVGVEVRNVRVIGSTSEFPKVVIALTEAAKTPDAILFLNDTTTAENPDAVGRLRAANTKLLRLPRLAEVTGGTVGTDVREFSVEELLARPAIKFDVSPMRSFIAGKRVLVTGGGGSIGSEICRQVSSLSCAHVSIVDNSEFALFSIDLQIATAHPGLSRRSILCDVRNSHQIAAWMESEKPDIVFHAAALKHVHLVEQHPGEGVLTNVVGTSNVADAAIQCGAKHMVLISTDKAVDPSNVMGATKRIAESVIRSRGHGTSTRFSAVRFGNVLGSAGSVVPIFMEQIQRGGPVTITHRDVERYFMTIPEAVQLVLHATASSAARENTTPSVFVLDMGRPVRIFDLARQMIQLCGKIPDEDIKIEFIGLKPGEKLTENLIDNSEIALPSTEGVIEVVDAGTPPPLSRRTLRDLEAVALSGDESAIRTAVFEVMASVRSAGSPKGADCNNTKA
ncbi:nucleoside-diphosphate sugar epimerase/dehydratase [uncultured Brevundimonas sp.]|uniref:nucleoside-diphosphate sugar epimerase/dehydratase n=1 Tax=uncultured Brevundimonas sp. TaxID=213418 RepID=UPI0030ED68FA|tara:strand:- start:3350 stop:5305 length:1956 start_codon:yes stop_codon:yes gene_type:complete